VTQATPASGRGEEGSEPQPRRRHLRGIAFICFGIALVLFMGELAWSFFFDGEPPAILPPAGEVLAGKAPFRFAVVGDNRGNMTVFEEILAQIREQKASFIVHTGDLVMRCSARQYEWLLHELDEEGLKVPFCAVPGNHDIYQDAEDPRARYLHYCRWFGPRQYWFAYGNALFVAFDDSYEKGSAPEDIAWLDRTLARLRDQYEACFVFLHVPPRDPRPGGRQAMGTGGPELVAVLKKHHVTAALAGHIHSYLEDNIEGIPIYITGGAGADLAENPPSTFHYLICTVEPGGSFHIEKHDVGDRIDLDRMEYLARVKFPAPAILVTAASLVGLGIVCLTVERLRRRRSSPPPT